MAPALQEIRKTTGVDITEKEFSEIYRAYNSHYSRLGLRELRVEDKFPSRDWVQELVVFTGHAGKRSGEAFNHPFLLHVPFSFMGLRGTLRALEGIEQTEVRHPDRRRDGTLFADDLLTESTRFEVGGGKFHLWNEWREPFRVLCNRINNVLSNTSAMHRASREDMARIQGTGLEEALNLFVPHAIRVAYRNAMHEVGFDKPGILEDYNERFANEMGKAAAYLEVFIALSGEAGALPPEEIAKALSRFEHQQTDEETANVLLFTGLAARGTGAGKSARGSSGVLPSALILSGTAADEAREKYWIEKVTMLNRPVRSSVPAHQVFNRIRDANYLQTLNPGKFDLKPQAGATWDETRFRIYLGAVTRFSGFSQNIRSTAMAMVAAFRAEQQSFPSEVREAISFLADPLNANKPYIGTTQESPEVINDLAVISRYIRTAKTQDGEFAYTFAGDVSSVSPNRPEMVELAERGDVSEQERRRKELVEALLPLRDAAARVMNIMAASFSIVSYLFYSVVEDKEGRIDSRIARSFPASLFAALGSKIDVDQWQYWDTLEATFWSSFHIMYILADQAGKQVRPEAWAKNIPRAILYSRLDSDMAYNPEMTQYLGYVDYNSVNAVYRTWVNDFVSPLRSALGTDIGLIDTTDASFVGDTLKLYSNAYRGSDAQIPANAEPEEAEVVVVGGEEEEKEDPEAVEAQRRLKEDLDRITEMTRSVQEFYSELQQFGSENGDILALGQRVKKSQDGVRELDSLVSQISVPEVENEARDILANVLTQNSEVVIPWKVLHERLLASPAPLDLISEGGGGGGGVPERQDYYHRLEEARFSDFVGQVLAQISAEGGVASGDWVKYISREWKDFYTEKLRKVTIKEVYRETPVASKRDLDQVKILVGQIEDAVAPGKPNNDASAATKTARAAVNDQLSAMRTLTNYVDYAPPSDAFDPAFARFTTAKGEWKRMLSGAYLKLRKIEQLLRDLSWAQETQDETKNKPPGGVVALWEVLLEIQQSVDALLESQEFVLRADVVEELRGAYAGIMNKLMPVIRNLKSETTTTSIDAIDDMHSRLKGLYDKETEEEKLARDMAVDSPKDMDAVGIERDDPFSVKSTNALTAHIGLLGSVDVAEQNARNTKKEYESAEARTQSALDRSLLKPPVVEAYVDLKQNVGKLLNDQKRRIGNMVAWRTLGSVYERREEAVQAREKTDTSALSEPVDTIVDRLHVEALAKLKEAFGISPRPAQSAVDTTVYDRYTSFMSGDVYPWMSEEEEEERERLAQTEALEELYTDQSASLEYLRRAFGPIDNISGDLKRMLADGVEKAALFDQRASDLDQSIAFQRNTRDFVTTLEAAVDLFTKELKEVGEKFTDWKSRSSTPLSGEWRDTLIKEYEEKLEDAREYLASSLEAAVVLVDAVSLMEETLPPIENIKNIYQLIRAEGSMEGIVTEFSAYVENARKIQKVYNTTGKEYVDNFFALAATTWEFGATLMSALLPVHRFLWEFGKAHVWRPAPKGIFIEIDLIRQSIEQALETLEKRALAHDNSDPDMENLIERGRGLVSVLTAETTAGAHFIQRFAVELNSGGNTIGEVMEMYGQFVENVLTAQEGFLKENVDVLSRVYVAALESWKTPSGEQELLQQQKNAEQNLQTEIVKRKEKEEKDRREREERRGDAPLYKLPQTPIYTPSSFVAQLINVPKIPTFKNKKKTREVLHHLPPPKKYIPTGRPAPEYKLQKTGTQEAAALASGTLIAQKSASFIRKTGAAAATTTTTISSRKAAAQFATHFNQAKEIYSDFFRRCDQVTSVMVD